MGTYTTNKKLFMPTVGETGWGELVNGNFSTIDNFLKPITVSGSTYTFTGNHVGNQSGGSVSATTGTFSGAVTGASFNGIPIKKNYTVTPYASKMILSNLSSNNQFADFRILPTNSFGTYSGSIRFTSTTATGDYKYVYASTNLGKTKVDLSNDTTTDYTFTNIKWLTVIKGATEAVGVYEYTLS